mmetsp:Transcript_4009/g.8028  ORF Transcript_4009/g.8028 Transcript_4009/m.8028 type:complete len:249 (-) Transcript_4009:1164-1910(-)
MRQRVRFCTFITLLLITLLVPPIKTSSSTAIRSIVRRWIPTGCLLARPNLTRLSVTAGLLLLLLLSVPLILLLLIAIGIRWRLLLTVTRCTRRMTVSVRRGSIVVAIIRWGSSIICRRGRQICWWRWRQVTCRWGRRWQISRWWGWETDRRRRRCPVVHWTRGRLRFRLFAIQFRHEGLIFGIQFLVFRDSCLLSSAIRRRVGRVPANCTLNGRRIFAHGEAFGASKGTVPLFRTNLTKLIILECTIQ